MPSLGRRAGGARQEDWARSLPVKDHRGDPHKEKVVAGLLLFLRRHYVEEGEDQEGKPFALPTAIAAATPRGDTRTC